MNVKVDTQTDPMISTSSCRLLHECSYMILMAFENWVWFNNVGVAFIAFSRRTSLFNFVVSPSSS